MPKRSKRSSPSPKARTTADRLKTRLAKCKKAELVDVLVRLAKENRDIQRQLESQFEVEAPPDELISASRVAIADATDFDVREINHNFDYDYQAYRTVQRNLARLVELGHLREAMELSKELMSKGSYQVEMSDEGMMTEDIESCLQVVIKAITKSDLPAADVAAWCEEMAQRDRVGFICDTELAALEQKLKRRLGLELVTLADDDDGSSYWFDFGDDWYHQIQVERIEQAIPTVTYPRVTRRVGKSPPQYADVE